MSFFCLILNSPYGTFTSWEHAGVIILHIGGNPPTFLLQKGYFLLEKQAASKDCPNLTLLATTRDFQVPAVQYVDKQTEQQGVGIIYCTMSLGVSHFET